MADYINQQTIIINDNEDKVAEVTSLLTAEKELTKALTQERDRLNDELEETLEDYKRIEEELRKLKTDTGVAELEEELEKFKNTADSAAREFTRFLQTVNLMDQYGDSPEDFSEWFESITSGAMTASEAIAQVKIRFAGLMEENYSKTSGAIDTDILKGFMSNLDSLGAGIEDIQAKISSIIEEGVKAVGGITGEGGVATADFSQALEQLKSAATGVPEEIRGAYDSITNLVVALTQYTELDAMGMSNISTALKGIAGIGNSSITKKNADNIITVIEAIKGSTGSIHLSLQGFDNLKVSKASMSNLATYLPEIAKVDASKLEALSRVDLSKYSDLRVTKSAVAGLVDLANASNGAGFTISPTEIKSSFDEIHNILSDIVTELKNNARTAVYEVKQAADDMAEAISEVFEESSYTPTTEYTPAETPVLGDGVADAVEEVGITAETAAVKFTDANQGIEESVRDVGEAAREEVELLKDAQEGLGKVGDRLARVREEFETTEEGIEELKATTVTYKDESGKTQTDIRTQTNKDGSSSVSTVVTRNVEKFSAKETEAELAKLGVTIQKIEGKLYELDKYGAGDSEQAKKLIEWRAELEKLSITLIDGTKTKKEFAEASKTLNAQTEESIKTADVEISKLRDKAKLEKAITGDQRAAYTSTIERKKTDITSVLSSASDLGLGDTKEYRALASEITHLNSLKSQVAQDSINNNEYESSMKRRTASIAEATTKLQVLIGKQKALNAETAKANEPVEKMRKSLISLRDGTKMYKIQLSDEDQWLTLRDRIDDFLSKVNTANDMTEVERVRWIETGNAIKVAVDNAAKLSGTVNIGDNVEVQAAALKRIVSAQKEITNNLGKWGSALPENNIENPSLTPMVGGTAATTVLKETNAEFATLSNLVKDGTISIDEFDKKFAELSIRASTANEAIIQAGKNVAAFSQSMSTVRAVYVQMQKIDKILENNSRGKGTEEYAYLEKLRAKLAEVYEASKESSNNLSTMTKVDLRKVTEEVDRTTASLKRSGAAGKTLAERFKGLTEKFGIWLGASTIVMRLVQTIKKMVSTVIELDTAMTELKKVTDATDKQYEQFLTNAIDRAKEFGATVTDVINASATFARLGYGLEDAAALADAALVYKNVGDGIEDIDTASESIISTMQAFGIAASDSMTIVDKFNEVGNNFAISSSGLGEALLRSASALHAANNTLEESIGLATAANTILQDPESVGTTLKTISMYLRAAKTEAEDAGESTDGMADSVSKLRDEILSLTGDKVDIMEATGTEFKSTTQILRELAGVWDELTDVTQANILEKIGGKRNANATSALITNFNIVEDAIKTASEAEGSALAENAKYLESIQGHIDRFKASFQELSALVVDSDVVKFFVDFGKVILDILNVIMKIADALGGLKNALGLGLSITLVKNVDAILEAIGGKLGKFTQILNDIKIAKLAALKGNTVEGITETLQGSTLAAQTLNQELSTMNVGVKDLTKGVKGFYKAMSTAQKAVLWIAIITTIFEIISKIVNKVKEANSLEVKLEALEESKTNIEDLNSQIEEIQETIDEINSSGSALSLTDKEDLKRLQEENAELKLQLELEKQIAAAKREEAAKVARKNVDAKMDEFNPMVEGGYAYSYFDDYNDYLEEMDALNEELADAIASSDTDNASKISDKISKTKGFYADFLDSLKSDLDNYYDWLGVLDENNPLDKERIDWINDRINEISVIIDKVGFVESKIQSLPSDVLNELENLGEYGSVTVATIAELYEKYPEFRDAMVAAGYTMADLAEHFNNLGESASDSSEELKSFKDGLDGIQNLSGGFETLGKIYADIQDGGDFDFSSIFANDDFEDTFGGLGGSYDAFIETISKSPRNIASCQEAFNNLVTEWIDGTGVLNDLNESNKSVAITMLNQMGITNAAAIVEERLGIAKAKSKLESEGLADATEAELVAKYNSANATDAERAAIAELIIERLKYNKAKLDTSGDIAGIVGLAKACGVAASAISRLSYLKSKYDEYVAVGNTRKAESYLAQMEATEKSINASVTEYLGAIYSPYTYGGSPSSSSESSSDSETWFEKQLKEHQHRINMDQETTAEYLAWLEKAYKQAYAEGIITLDDYYKYAEEVYSGLHDLFTSHLDDVETQIENMGRYADSGDEILKVYDSVLLEIEKEIAAARAQGLTDETEYIKTLKEKYWSFYDARKEMLKEYGEDSKSAMEDLIDMRVDMLKQDIENERDALDEKLDALHDFYDKQRELLDEMADEEDYQKDQAEKRKAITDLKLQLAQLENDDSAWAAKRRIELNEELQDAEEALSEFERDKAREVAKKALDDAEESETKVLEDRISELEKLLDDPYALRQRAIADLRENNGELYQEMIDWNKKYGDGIDETITSKWEEAYIACQKYFSLLKSYYEDISLDNMTGYEFVSGGGQAKTIGGVPKYNAGSDYAKLMAAAANSGDMELAAIYEEYRNRKIRENGLNYSTTNQYSKYLPEDYSTSGIPSYNPNLDYWTLMNEAAAAGDYRLAAIYERYRNRKIREIGLKQSTTDMYTKYLPSGYASGTKYATEGIHKFDEDGSEYIFTSANGSRYRLFSAGDKVLPSGATNFLYDFALKGQDILGGITKKLNEVMYFGSRSKSETPIINMGDIIIQGNANDKTVSEIRRAQREGIDYILKEFGKLKA